MSEVLRPLFLLSLFLLSFLLARWLVIAGQLHSQFGYTWPEAFRDAARFLFDLTL